MYNIGFLLSFVAPVQLLFPLLNSNLSNHFKQGSTFITNGSGTFTTGVQGDFTIVHNFGFISERDYVLTASLMVSSTKYIVTSNENGNQCYCQLIDGQTGKFVSNTTIDVIYVGIGDKYL